MVVDFFGGAGPWGQLCRNKREYFKNFKNKYENVMNKYEKVMNKLSRNGLWDVAFWGGWSAGPWLPKYFGGGDSRDLGRQFFVARAGPVAISDVLWQGPVPWSFNPDIF